METVSEVTVPGLAPDEPPTRLLLLRHAEVEDRYHRRFGGRIDMGLSPRGQTQARALAGYLKLTRLDALYVSPMKRARQTMEPIAAATALTPSVVPDLREVDFGDWTGLSWTEVGERFRVSALDWLHRLDDASIPNGESNASFRLRVEPCLLNILQSHPGQTVAVVCHGGVIRMMLSILLRLPLPATGSFEIEYASLTRLLHRLTRTEIDVLNFTPWRDMQ
jgi:broad specificity phosphatase PhoE